MFIDVSRYVRPPRIGAASGFLLVTRLLRAAPAEPSDRVHAALARMRESGEHLQSVLRERARLATFSLRPYDQDFDACWAAFHMRLSAHARRPKNPHAARASTLLEQLFSTGLNFLTLGYEDQWLHSHTLLQRFEAEGLTDELGSLVGQEFLVAVQEAHAVLGEALGVGEGEPERTPSLSEALTELAAAIADYSRVLAGELDMNDPESTAAFERAMAPREAHMARRSRPRAAGDQASEAVEDEPSVDEILDAALPELPPLADSAVV